MMKTEAMKVMRELVDKFDVSLEEVAVKTKMSFFTVRSWVVGARIPGVWAMKKLQQILRGYESKK